MVLNDPTALPMVEPAEDDLDDWDDLVDSNVSGADDDGGVIRARVLQMDWHVSGQNHTTTTPKNSLVKLPIPSAVPDPNSMHTFVQFQVRI